jgi:hypothetical protein
MKAERHAPISGSWRFALSIACAVAVLAAFLLILHR